MLDAVITYGDLGKSGNKVINLVDSKLYTKNSKCVEIDENLNQIFIDLVLEHLQSLWDNDMIEEWISRQELLFEQKWKILEVEIQDLAQKREELKQQSIQVQGCQEPPCFFFRGITNVLTLKKRYKDLIKIYHPDNLAGDTLAIQEINKQYEELQQKL